MKLTKKHEKAIVTKKKFLGKYEVYLVSNSCVILNSCGAIWTVPNEGFMVVKPAPKQKTGNKD